MFPLQVCVLVGLVINIHVSSGQLPIPDDLPMYRLIPQNCRLLPVSGLCQDRMMRYFYNLTSETCEPFAYTGCNGNNNNFLTEADCKSACMCAQPLQPGRCHSRSHLGLRRTFFDAMSGECKQLHSARCQMNSNVFPTMTQCQGTCSVCGLSVDPGPCNGNYTRFFFNKASRRCEQFAYGGCGGNANKFLSLADCGQKCSIQKKKFSVRLINSGNRLRQRPTLSSLLTVRLPETLRRLSSYSRTSGSQKVNRDTILQNSVHSKQTSTTSNLKTVTRNMMRVNLTSLSRNQRRRIHLNIPRHRRTRPTSSSGTKLPVFFGNQSADSVQLTRTAEIREISEYYTEVPTEPAELENPPTAATKTQTRKQIYHPKVYRIRFRFGVPSASRSTKTLRSGVVQHKTSTTAILPRSPDQNGSTKALSKQAIASETIQITDIDVTTNNSKPVSTNPQSNSPDTTTTTNSQNLASVTSTSRATVAKPTLRKLGSSHKANILTGLQNRVKEIRALFRLNQNETNSSLTSSKPDLAAAMSNSRLDKTTQRRLGSSRQISSPGSNVSLGTLAARDITLSKDVNETTSALKLEHAADQRNIIMKQTSMKVSPLPDAKGTSRVVVKSSAPLGSTANIIISGAAILSQTTTAPKLVISTDSNNVPAATTEVLKSHQFLSSTSTVVNVAENGKPLPSSPANSVLLHIKATTETEVSPVASSTSVVAAKIQTLPPAAKVFSVATSRVAASHASSSAIVSVLTATDRPLISSHKSAGSDGSVPIETATSQVLTLNYSPNIRLDSDMLVKKNTQGSNQLLHERLLVAHSSMVSKTQAPTQVKSSAVEYKVASRTLPQLSTQAASAVDSKVASRTLQQLPTQAAIIDPSTAHQTSKKTQQEVASVVDSNLAVSPSVPTQTTSATNSNLASNVTSQVSAMVMSAEAKVPNVATHDVPQQLPDSIGNLPVFRSQAFGSSMSTDTHLARKEEPSVLPTMSSHPPQNADLQTSDLVVNLPVFHRQTTQWGTNFVPVQNIQGSSMYSSYQSPVFIGDLSTTEAYTDYIQSIYEHTL